MLHALLMVSLALTNSVQHSFVSDFAEVGSLNLSVNTRESAAEGIFRRRVDHLALLWR